jgi:ATP-dependent Lon protease
MASALASLYTGRKVRSDTSMTGEITLSGLVFPVGGIKEKVLAAHRAGIRRIILPLKNEADIEEIPEDVRGELEIITVNSISDVLKMTLEAEVTHPLILPTLDGSHQGVRNNNEEQLIAKEK